VPAELAPGGLTLAPALHVSFQRYPRPGADVIARAPSSFGALPVARAAGGALALPVAADEAFWIGLEMRKPDAKADLAVRFELAAQAAVDALSGEPWSDAQATWIAVPPHASVDGIAIPGGGFRPFVRTALAREDGSTAALDLVTRGDAARVLLVAYATFASMTGHAPPALLDRGAQYGGWRLP
jgi:hypothetical protein